MAATTTLLGLVTPTQGTLSGTWGDTVNYGISDYVDISIAGTLTLTGDGAVTLANTTGSSSGNSITSTLAGAGTVTAQFSAVRVSGTTTTKVVTGPSYSKTYLLDNASSYAVTFKASGQTGVSISPGEKVYVYYNATDYVKVGGGGITYGAVKTTTYTAVSNDGVLTNTTGGAFTVNLPATPSTGTQVFIADSAGTWGTNNLTIGRNGSTIAGSATDLVCDINSVSIQCIYDGTTWDIFAQIGANNTAVLTQTNTVTGITNKTFVAPVLGAATATSLQGIIGNVTPAAGTFTSVRATSLVSTGTSQTAGANQLALVQSGATSILVAYGAGVGSGNRGAYDFYQSDSAAGNIQIPLSISSAGAVSALTTFAAGTTIAVGAATPSSSGAGITFPATQSASSDANTLDDYEEGTWTPNQGSGLTVVGTFSSTGTYTKVGRVVTVCFRVAGSTTVALSTGGTITTNLPFSATTGVYGYGTGSNNASSISTTFQASTLDIYGTTSIAATPYIFGSITYFV